MTTALDRDEIINDTFRRLEGSIDIAQPPPAYTRDSNRGSYDPSLNLNFKFGTSSTSKPSKPVSIGSSSAYHKHRNTSSLGSEFTKLVHSTNNRRVSDCSFHTAQADPTEHRVSWGEPSTRRHSNRHRRVSASSDLTPDDHHTQIRSTSAVFPSRRSSGNVVVVDRTQYQIMRRPRTPLHFPSSSAPSLPGRSGPAFSTDEMSDMMEPHEFDLAPSSKRSRSLSESDKGSDGRSSNRAE